MATYSIPQMDSSRGIGQPASFLWLITPNDDNDLIRVTRAVRCGGTGDLAVRTLGGDIIIIPSVVAGELLPIQVMKVYATDTTATEIMGLA